MKKFIKILFSIFGLFTAAIGALAVVDKLINKNRIEGDYLDCTQEDITKDTED